MDSKYEEPPSVKALDEGYNQTYLIMNRDENAKDDVGHEVLFRCGNWCYKGLVQFSELKVCLEDVPVVIPVLQRQQGSLRYYCTAKSIPAASEHHGPMKFMDKALEFIASELTSEVVQREIEKKSSVFPWIEEDSAATFFELAINALPACMESVRLVASKTYARGLVIIAIYYDNAVYCVIQSGEGDQPLLDVRFPDVSKHNQGVMLNSYNHSEYRKLTLWHNISTVGTTTASLIKKDLPKLKTVDISHKNYEQTYVILHSAFEANSSLLSNYHDVMFRFGSWCYSGRVQLTAQLSLYDVPYVIPALRMQQSRLDYVCDVTALPVTSPFASIMQFMKRASESVEEILLTVDSDVENVLKSYGGPSNHAVEDGAFFEFSLSIPREVYIKISNVEMVVSKMYHPSGIVTIAIFFQTAIYVCLQDNSHGEHPLLDSRFPVLQYAVHDDYRLDYGEGNPQAVGHVLQHFDKGTRQWPELRKLTLWVTPPSSSSPASTSAIIGSGSGSLATINGPVQVAEAKPSSSTSSLTMGAKASKDQPLEAVMVDSKAQPAPSARISSSSPTAASAPGGVGATPAELKSDAKLLMAPLPSFKQALPHHLPKLNDSLAGRLESIRSAMGEEGLHAPWDLRGKPLGKMQGESK